MFWVVGAVKKGEKMSEQTFGELLKDRVTGSLATLVESANNSDLAYCEATGNKYGAHVPFGADKPEAVASNPRVGTYPSADTSADG